MNESNDRLALIKEMAIFDYVAGNQSPSAKINFEKMLRQDPALRQAVEEESRLRANMQLAGALNPVPSANFDSLLKAIEGDEQQLLPEADLSVIPYADNKPSFLKFGDSRNYVAVAASLAFFAIAMMAVYQNSAYQGSTEPKFETLSNTLASERINFTELVEQGRVAKITLDKGISESQSSVLWLDYNLTIFEAGAQAHQHYVVSESVITQSDMARWQDNPWVLQVELFVNVDEG